MGAEWFYETGYGASAKEVFDALVKDARYEHGHGGYSGTIADKTEFKTVPLPPSWVEGVPTGDDVEEAAWEIPEEAYSKKGKWGAAGCFNLGGGKYSFFGFAAS